MDLEDAETSVKFVLHDRDASFTTAFDAVFQAAGARVVRSAIQAPRMNSIMERWIGSCRRKLLDRTLAWNQRHLMAVLREYEGFYNTHRPARRGARCQMMSPAWTTSASGGATAAAARSMSIAWWHRFSAPTGLELSARRAGPGDPGRARLAGTLDHAATLMGRLVEGCRCRKLCHPMRPGRFHGSGRRAGPGAEYACPSLPWADAPSDGWVLLQRPVRPMDVVVVGVLAEDQPQVPSAGDQYPVQALAPGAVHPAFRDRIRAGRLERALDYPRADRGEHSVGRRGELGIPVPDQELEAISLALEDHQQVTGLLGH
jgi:hypothetical protein